MSKSESSFIHKVTKHLGENGKKVFPDFDDFNREIFLIAAERGLNDDEFTILINLFIDGSLSIVNKKKLLPNLIPCVKAPSEAMLEFMCWFISRYYSLNKSLACYILQWIIGLLDNGLVDPNDIDGFYFDLYSMFEYTDLIKYSCKLICKLTKPQDVTGSAVRKVSGYFPMKNPNDNFLLAVLSLFKGYKPHLVSLDFKSVDINSVLKSVPHNLGSLFELRVRRHFMVLKEPGVIKPSRIISQHFQEGCHKLSSLVPFPTYSAEGLDRIITCYPRSIEEAFHKFKSVPIPENVLSLLRDQVGFFIIMNHSADLQMKLSKVLLYTLQDVLINQVQDATEDDKIYLLNQIYHLQISMQQGISCVSTFLAGFLLNWDGLSYRIQILNLVEWANFDSYTQLSANILRPLYLLFCTNDIAMRQQILQAVSNLIRNMMVADLYRVNQERPYPFLGQAPRWTQEPLAMLTPLIRWTEQLIKVGLCLTPKDGNFLLQAIHFYEMMNMLEAESPIPMWTVVTCGVVYHSVFNITPIQLNRVCRLLVRYHKEFLPKLRRNHPKFYNECTDKMNTTAKYIQELMNLLWIGQAMSRKEDGIVFKKIPDADLAALNPRVINLDTGFDLAHNINFLPYIIKERQNNGPQFCQRMEDFFNLVDFYLEDIAEFIRYFSPSDPVPPPPSLTTS